MKLKTMLLSCFGLVLVAALAIGGTVAYLTSEDSAVNVMTLGNVKIEQHEYERAEGVGHINAGAQEGELVPFVQGQLLYPAVPTAEDAYEAEQAEGSCFHWGVYSPGWNGLWNDSKLSNVMDKFVFVENTGKSDAYYRTLIALECPEGMTIGYSDDDEINVNVNGNSRFTWDYSVGYITVEGTRYEVWCATYNESLTPGEVSRPSLLQVVLTHNATNEDMALLGDTYEILVLSQAIQTAGFADAETALDSGFGDVTDEAAAEWFLGVVAKHSVDAWDGTADTSWYNATDTEFTLSSAEQFAGFAALVAEDSNNFEGKTITLGVDIDLGGESFAPIGSTSERDDRGRLITEPFKGTFDGNGKTIANLYQSGWDFGYEWGQYGSIGLFSELEGATVKNVVLEGFDCCVEGGDIAFIAGSATGDCTFENIEIKSGSIGTYNNGIGGIIGWSGAGTYNFKNITLGEDVVIGGLWGSFDSSAGGIVGQAEPGATYNFENVDIACRLDVYNDCTASNDYYNYRMCGMIIGRLAETTTIDGANYPDTSKYNITCKNVTVTYGDWANYHYCDPTPGYNNGRGMRVEPGYAYDGLPADYDHSQCTQHHMELIPFDQIFGGDQYGVKGLKTYEGVTVIYNNQ